MAGVKRYENGSKKIIIIEQAAILFLLLFKMIYSNHLYSN